MKQKKTMVYEAPELELMELFVEQGFALSEGDGDIDSTPDNDYGEFTY
ncbi:MAG: hypothetical protein Q4A18_00210 [Rikenellaceae bacterium]|nr:hypothetical protein [Rikenellaceae bacterium]